MLKSVALARGGAPAICLGPLMSQAAAAEGCRLGCRWTAQTLPGDCINASINRASQARPDQRNFTSVVLSGSNAQIAGQRMAAPTGYHWKRSGSMRGAQP